MSFPPYPKYKPSGVEWLGDVPEHWEVRRFKTVFHERQERSLLGEETLLSVSAYTGVSPRSEVIDDGEHLSRAESLEGYKVCYKNDLVMNIMLAWNRGLAVTSFDGIVSPAYSVFQVVDDSNPGFLNYLMRSDEYILYFKAFSAGVIDSRLRLYPDTFAQLSCCRPPLAEQRQIAAFLDRETGKIDELVAGQRRLIELLKEKRQAVISHAVTRGLNPNAPTKPSGIQWLGNIPEHWEVKRLKYLGEAQIGLTYDPGEVVDDTDGVLVLRSSNVQGGQISFDDNVYVRKQIPTRLQTQLGDILICSRNGSRALIGKNAVIGQNAVGLTFGAFMTIFRSPLNGFLFWAFNSQMFELQSGSFLTATINQLTIGNLNSFEILLPPSVEQSEIAKFLETETAKIDALTAEAERAIELLQERRTALISSAVTGKIDVRNAV